MLSSQERKKKNSMSLEEYNIQHWILHTWMAWTLVASGITVWISTATCKKQLYTEYKADPQALVSIINWGGDESIEQWNKPMNSVGENLLEIKLCLLKNSKPEPVWDNGRNERWEWHFQK